VNIPSGGIELEVEAAPPSKSSVPLLILAHPHPRMGGDMHNKVIDQLFRRSREKGWGAVRFNFRGVGSSTGEYDAGAGEEDDLMNTLCWAAGRFDRRVEDFNIVGYSFGSWISAKVAARLSEIRKLILIAPPVNIMDFSPANGIRFSKHVFAAERDEIVPLADTKKWYEGLAQPKTLHVIPEATHFFVGQTTVLLRSVLRVLEID
jgi:uncharacterized protein